MLDQEVYGFGTVQLLYSSLSTLKNSLTMLDSLLVVSCINRCSCCTPASPPSRNSLAMLDSLLVVSCINR